MPGLDPGIHEAIQSSETILIGFADTHHGLPGQARQRLVEGPAPLRQSENAYSAAWTCGFFFAQ